ncbi:MAG TPA: DNA repair protein RecO [Thermopetrobacter sp.]|nr:DNA repair protein RecO [Thermopetrobacter sp.]
MQWDDEAIIVSVRPHGETSALVEVFARRRGRWRGLVRGGRSRHRRPVLQAGNKVRATWRARLEDQLGSFAIEPVAQYAPRIWHDPAALAGLEALLFGLRLLPERDAHERLHAGACVVLERLAEDGPWPALLARFEMRLLAELGFGLDLSACAAGGAGPLVWVSPKSGRAVSEEAGRPYADRLLRLPAFLHDSAAPAAAADIRAAFALTGHFLNRHVLQPRGLTFPPGRARLLARLGE